eukprot:4224502-Pleurochrysis_carterae.AAC.2
MSPSALTWTHCTSEWTYCSHAKTARASPHKRLSVWRRRRTSRRLRCTLECAGDAARSRLHAARAVRRLRRRHVPCAGGRSSSFVAERVLVWRGATFQPSAHDCMHFALAVLRPSPARIELLRNCSSSAPILQPSGSFEASTR